MATKREHNLNVRVSTEERTVIRSRARARGLGLSEHVRRAASGECEHTAPIDVSALVVRDGRLRGLLRRLWAGIPGRRAA